MTVTVQVRSYVTISTGHTHLIFELLTELQGNGEKHQSVIQPRHYTLHLMDVAHLKLGVVVFTWGENKIIWNNTKPSSNRLFKKKKKSRMTLWYCMRLAAGVATWKQEMWWWSLTTLLLDYAALNFLLVWSSNRKQHFKTDAFMLSLTVKPCKLSVFLIFKWLDTLVVLGCSTCSW